MNATAAFRRLLVTIGIAASLALAGVTIRAASSWAAAEAPLTIAPVSVESVQGALDQERARSAALEAQLASLGASATDLRAALEAAQSQVTTDRTTADQLRASLDAAQHKLASLQAALRAAATGGGSGGGAGGGSGAGSGGGSGGGDDGGGHDD
jgi:septal ring factor EnvC (AmiA/AmiB activator)